MKTLLQTTQFLTRIRHEGHLIFPFHVCMQNVTHTLRTCAVPKAIARTAMQICSGYALTLKLLRQASYWFLQVHEIFQCKIYLYISKGRQQRYIFSSFAWGIYFTFIFKLDLLLNCILMSLKNENNLRAGFRTRTSWYQNPDVQFRYWRRSNPLPPSKHRIKCRYGCSIICEDHEIKL